MKGTTILKIIFYTSLFLGLADIIAIYVYNNLGRNSTQLFPYINQLIVTAIILAVLIIWWIIYFVITKDFSLLWIPIVLVLTIVIPIADSVLQPHIQARKDAQAKVVWLAEAKDETFHSDTLGISFKYISKTENGGNVSVQENKNIVTINTRLYSESGALEVFSKDAHSTLVDFLKNKYGQSYPACTFTDTTSSIKDFNTSNGMSGLPKLSDTYSIVDMSGTLSDDCPKIGIEVKTITAIQNYFIMDNTVPSKYMFLSLADYPILSSVPKNPSDFPPTWYETITFQ